LDGSKPLGLLEHVGGSPTIAAVQRSKVSVEKYDLLAKWLGVGYDYFEKYGLPQMPERERKKFEQFAVPARPLVLRAHQTTREMLLPSLADGQVAVVIDTKLRSRQFLHCLPATENPLPMVEPALVLGVSDADLLRKACVEYRAIFEGLIDAARKVEGSHVPDDFRLPEAKLVQKPAGTLYTFALPAEWGVSKSIVPNAGLSSNVAVLSINTKHTERLLTATPPSVQGRSVPSDRPLVGASVLDFAGLIEAVTPWIDLGVETAAQQSGQEGAKGKAAMILNQTHTVLDVLKVLRSITSESYFEDGALVHHSEVDIRDLPE
jgi:hypothetical protein